MDDSKEPQENTDESVEQTPAKADEQQMPSGMKKHVWLMTILAVAILILIVVLAWILIADDDEDDDTTNVSAEVTEVVDEPTDTQPADDVVVPDPQEEAELVAVDGSIASGTATRSYDGTTFTHTVTIMALNDPAEGMFYEGWIVGPSIISTGELVKEGQGQWSLTFTSEEDLTSHDRVVITEETSANGLDGVPERHVLEGSF